MRRLASCWLAISVALAGLGACSHAPVVTPTAAPATAPFHEQGLASFYADNLAGRRTANGQYYRPDMLTAAHRSLPFGTYLRVTARQSGRSVVVRVNDRGPYVAGRIVDLSREAAVRLGLIDAGVLEVLIEEIPVRKTGGY